MTVDEERSYWPFPTVAEEEQTDYHRERFAFFQAAYDAGFGPYVFDGIHVGAESKALRRTTKIWHRGGRRQWEVVFLENKEPLAAGFVRGFTTAAELATAWLSGSTEEDAWTQLKARGGYRLVKRGEPVEDDDLQNHPKTPRSPSPRPKP